MSGWQRWLQQPQRVWLRRALFQVHLWTGLILGLYVVVLSAIIEDAQSRPASVEFARLWAREFELTVPLLIDSEFQTASFIDLNAMPCSVVIDAATMSIVETGIGADTGPDPLGKYRALLDHALSSL